MPLIPNVLRLLPAIVIEGIEMWVRPPPSLNLRVVPMPEEPQLSRRPIDEHLLLLAHPNRTRPPIKIIHLHLVTRQYGTECFSYCHIAVDLHRRTIDREYTSPWLIDHEDMGSGAIGLALFSLPVTLPLAPFLSAASMVYRILETQRGMSRYGWAVLRALKGQLDAETEALLTDAFKNTWREEQRLASTR